MLSYKTVESHTLELLKGLMKEPLFSSLRLVGGTALALQYGHRSSIDLDFFGKIDAEDEVIKDTLRKYGKLLVLKESKNIKCQKAAYEYVEIIKDIIHSHKS